MADISKFDDVSKLQTYEDYIANNITEQERQDITEQAKERDMSVASYIRYLVAKEMKEREK